MYDAVEREDGTWIAWYPEDGTVFEGRTRDEAVQQLPIRAVVAMPRLTEVGPDRWEAVYAEELGTVGQGTNPDAAVSQLRDVHRAKLQSDDQYRQTHHRLMQGDHPPWWAVVFHPRNQLEGLLREQERLRRARVATERVTD